MHVSEQFCKLKSLHHYCSSCYKHAAAISSSSSSSLVASSLSLFFFYLNSIVRTCFTHTHTFLILVSKSATFARIVVLFLKKVFFVSKYIFKIVQIKCFKYIPNLRLLNLTSFSSIHLVLTTTHHLYLWLYATI